MRLRAELQRLRCRVGELERAVVGYERLVTAVRRARVWEFAPYDQPPDGSWVALDREDAHRLMQSLAGIDHWRPWQSRLEARSA